VPDLLADEMAADLEADLVDAQADGVSTTEMFGESDPRRFAATWASERGLVSEPAPQKRRRIWPWIVALLLFVFVLPLAWLFLQIWGSGHASSSPPVRVRPQPVQSVRVPDLVGMTACQARRAAVDAGLTVHEFARNRCNAAVGAQRPVAGAPVFPRSPQANVTLRLRG
jgi:hypothetical protein